VLPRHRLEQSLALLEAARESQLNANIALSGAYLSAAT
jgi:hypothetical protein